MAEFKVVIDDKVLESIKQIIQDDTGSDDTFSGEQIITELLHNDYYLSNTDLDLNAIIKVEEINKKDNKNES